MSSSTSSDNSTSDNSSSDNTTSITTTSAGNTIFNTSPSSSFSLKTTYKIRVTTGAKDLAGNTISSQYETASGFTTTGWKKLADMSTGRDRHASVVLSDKLYIIGGRSSGSYISSVEMYDISSNSWTSKNNLPNTLVDAESVTYNNYIYLVGGTSDNFSKYDTSNDSWTSLGSTYCRSHECRAVMIGSTLYVMGRLSSSTSGVSNYTALKAYSFSGSSWSTKASMSTGRAHFGAAVYDSKIYVFGGQSGSGSYDLTDSVEVYDPSTNSWSNHTTIPSSQLLDLGCSDYTTHHLGGSGYPILATNVGSKIVISSLLAHHTKTGASCVTNGKILVYDVSGNSWSSGDYFSTNQKMYTSDSVAASSTKVYYSGSNSGSSNSNKALFSYTP
jgi:hypothetical protein